MEKVIMDFDFDEYNSMIETLKELEYFSKGCTPSLAAGCMAIFEHAGAGAMMHEWKLLRVDEPNNKFYIYAEMDKYSARRFKFKSTEEFIEHEKKELELQRKRLIIKLVIRTLIVGAIGFIAGALAANLL